MNELISKFNFTRINEIIKEIDYHQNRIALHQRAINKLRKEKSLLMAFE